MAKQPSPSIKPLNHSYRSELAICELSLWKVLLTLFELIVLCKVPETRLE
jgi:hypothetical protein